jgi:hypothetical protein
MWKPEDVATLLGRSVQDVRDLCTARLIPYYQIVGVRRFRPDEVCEWADTHPGVAFGGCVA